MRPILRASGVCLLMAAMSAGGCGLDPDEVGSVVAGAIKPDAFTKLQDYYSGKPRPQTADGARGRPAPERRAAAGNTLPDDMAEPEVATTAERPKSQSEPSAAARAAPVEQKPAQPPAEMAKAPPVIVEPAKPQSHGRDSQRAEADAERQKRPEPAAPAIKAPPVIVETAKAAPPALETKPPPVIVEAAKPAASAGEVRHPPVLVEKSAARPAQAASKAPETKSAEIKPAEVKPPPVIVEREASEPKAPANGVPPILASRSKPEKASAPAVGEPKSDAASGPDAMSGSASDAKPAAEAMREPVKPTTRAAALAKRKKERWVPISPTEAELAAAAAKAPALPLATATALPAARKQWITPPPSERELPAANANSPVYALPPTAPVPALPSIERTAAARNSTPASAPAIVPKAPPPTTAALPSDAKKPPVADRPKEPLSFRDECLKRASQQTMGDDVQDEGISLDEKLAIDALCEKVLKRTALDPSPGPGQ